MDHGIILITFDYLFLHDCLYQETPDSPRTGILFIFIFTSSLVKDVAYSKNLADADWREMASKHLFFEIYKY